MNILITGSSGLLGYPLVNKLSQKHTLYLLTTNPKLISTENLNYIYCDLSTDFNTINFPKNMDIIIHLAQSPLYKSFPATSENIFKINIQSTQKLLDYGLQSNIQHFIYTSSGSVYEPYNISLNEDAFLNPTSYYANSKLIAERLIKSYEAFFNTSIFRLFFLYGSHPQNKQTLINSIINKIKKNELISIEGNKSGLVFSPTLTNDIANFFDFYINYPKSGIYNLTNPQSISLLEVTEILSQKLNIKPNLSWNKEKNSLVITPRLDKFTHDFPNFKFTDFKQSLQFLENYFEYHD